MGRRGANAELVSGLSIQNCSPTVTAEFQTKRLIIFSSLDKIALAHLGVVIFSKPKPLCHWEAVPHHLDHLQGLSWGAVWCSGSEDTWLVGEESAIWTSSFG